MEPGFLCSWSSLRLPARLLSTDVKRPSAVRCWQKRPGPGGSGAFWLFRGGGQGRGRTADLPLFRRNNRPAAVPSAEVGRCLRCAGGRQWWRTLPSALPSTGGRCPPARPNPIRPCATCVLPEKGQHPWYGEDACRKLITTALAGQFPDADRTPSSRWGRQHCRQPSSGRPIAGRAPTRPRDDGSRKNRTNMLP
jgi:hypothetical protein